MQAGVIEVTELIAPQKLPSPSEHPINADTTPKQAAKPVGGKKAGVLKPSILIASKPEVTTSEPAPSPSSRTNGPTKGTKQPTQAVPVSVEAAPRNVSVLNSESYAIAAQRAKSPPLDKPVPESAMIKNATASLVCCFITTRSKQR